MKTESDLRRPRVGIVGPCTSGKSTLITNLRRVQAVELRHIAQEHSYVQTMWQHISKPDWLVFLDVSYPVTIDRNPRLNWSEEDYQEQQRRLAHAREHANIIISTDGLTPEQVAEKVLAFLNNLGLGPTEE